LDGTHIEALLETGFFNPIDVQFARFLRRLSGSEDPQVLLAAALTSKYTQEGHICLDMKAVAGTPVPDNQGSPCAFRCPGLESWTEALGKSPVVGRPGQFRPLILDGALRLYLYRYFMYEKTLADTLVERAGTVTASLDPVLLKEGLARLFPADPSGEADWQKVAAATALVRRWCVITGGPGTGKTHTITKILALLVEQARTGRCRVALAAPTGKAAARLAHSIRTARGTLACAHAVKERIPDQASTLHRLLGTVPHSPYFRHDRNNPLAVDAVVLDEASMVDLALMSKLVDALPSQARLIVLGDKDQLASVEAGAVLGDLCHRGPHRGFSRPFAAMVQDLTGHELETGPQGPGPPVRDSVMELRRNYRFAAGSGIGRLSALVNAGDTDGALKALRHGGHPELEWKHLPPARSLGEALKSFVLGSLSDYLSAGTPGEALARFERFRILCAVRQGPYGVVHVNRLVEGLLWEKGLISPETPWYHGRPVCISRNDYSRHLFNGDLGLLWNAEKGQGRFRAFFPASDDAVRSLAPLSLPAHETVYAMTVHKSQGSEFEEVVLILPNQVSPVLTRELLYTAITRAQKKVRIFGPEAVIGACVAARIRRASGLRDALWGSGDR